MNALHNILKLSSAQRAGSQILRNSNSSSILESIGPYCDRHLEVKKYRSKSLSPSNSKCPNGVIRDDELVTKKSASTIITSKTSSQRKKGPVMIKISVSSRKYGTLQRFFDKFKFWTNTSGSDDYETAKKSSTYLSKSDFYDSHQKESTTEEIETLKQLLKAEKLKTIITSEAAQPQTESTPIIQAKTLGTGIEIFNAALKNSKERETSSIFAIKKGYQVCRTCGGRHWKCNKNKQYFSKLATEPKTSPSDNLQEVTMDSPRWKLYAENFDVYKFSKLVPERSVPNPWTSSNPIKTPSNQVKHKMARFQNNQQVESFVTSKKQMAEEVIPSPPPSLSSITKPKVKKEVEQSQMILKLSPNKEFYEIKNPKRSLQKFERPKLAQSRSRIIHLSKFPFHCDSSCMQTATSDTPATHREDHYREVHTKVGHLSESSMKRKDEEQPDETDVKKTGPSLSGKQLVYRQLGIDKSIEKYKKCKSFIEGGKIIDKGLRNMWTNRKK